MSTQDSGNRVSSPWMWTAAAVVGVAAAVSLGKWHRADVPEPTPREESKSSDEVFSDSDVISFLTDVEGSMEYVERFVSRSRVLKWSTSGTVDKHGVHKFKPGMRLDFTHPTRQFFVFGGDLFDKGPWDATLSELFVDFKERYPDRVFLLMGNRDINKLRLASELHESDLARDLSEIHILPGDKGTIADYLKAKGDTVVRENTVVNRLKHCYINTLGCPKTFQYRKVEIARQQGKEVTEITDADVVSDVLTALQPGGWVVRFLRAAQIGVLLGDTLFIHGSVNEDNMGVVPTEHVRYKMMPDTPVPVRHMPANAGVREWIAELNRFATLQLDQFQRQPLWNENRTYRGAEALIAWQSSPASAGKTPIVVSYTDKGALKPISESVVKYLLASGVRRVCVGHKPAGSCPLPLRVRGGLHIVDADLSRAGEGLNDPSNVRGIGVAEVLVMIPRSAEKPSSAFVHGQMYDGRVYSFLLSTEDSLGDQRIGKMTPDGFVVTAKCDSSSPATEEAEYVLARTRHRKEEVQFVSAAMLPLSTLSEVPTTDAKAAKL